MNYRGYEICDTEAPFADLRFGWYREEGEECMGFGATVEDCMAGIDEELGYMPGGDHFAMRKRPSTAEENESRVSLWQSKILRSGAVPRYTAWRMQILNGLVFPVQRGIDGLLMRKQPLKDFQRELIR